VWSEILKMAPGGRGGIRKPGGRGSGGGQQGSEGNRQQPKPQPPQAKTAPKGPGTSTSEQPNSQGQPQMSADFGAFQQMWNNPQF
jgi:hypothetical protein